MSEIDDESEEKIAQFMLIFDLKHEKIYRDMDYEELQNEIMKGSLSVNTHIKLDATYHLIFFKKVGYTETYYLTILHLAICLEDEEFVDFLLRNNADITIATEHVGPVIYSAIRLEKLDYIRKLVDAGASVNASFCLRGLELDEVFLRNDSGTQSYREYRYDDYTPLQYAIKVSSYDIIEYLLSQNADVNYKGSKDIPPPFNLAAQFEPKDFTTELYKSEIMKLLIEHGADINLATADGYHKTPLLIAASDPKYISVIKFLLDQPTIELNVVDNHKRSCLHLYLMASKYHNDIYYLDILVEILDAGMDVNLVDDDQKLAIDMEVSKDRRNCIKIVKMHIVVLMAANFYVCPKNAEATVGPEFEKFRAECNQEVELLRTFRDPITEFFYYDLLHKSLHKLCLRLKNCVYDKDNIEGATGGSLQEYKKIIIYRLKKASQRVELFNKVENVLYEIFGTELPATIIHQIFFYLSNSDLLKLSINK